MTVLFFAAAREAAGVSEATLNLPDTAEGGGAVANVGSVATVATVATALELLAASTPGLALILPSCRTALDEEFAPRSAPLRDGATLAVLPPVSGG